jgi:hypothetical protein
MRVIFKYIIIIIFTSCKTPHPQIKPFLEEEKPPPAKIKKEGKARGPFMLASDFSNKN